MAYLNVFYFYKEKQDALKPVSLYHVAFECWKHFCLSAVHIHNVMAQNKLFDTLLDVHQYAYIHVYSIHIHPTPCYVFRTVCIYIYAQQQSSQAHVDEYFYWEASVIYASRMNTAIHVIFYNLLKAYTTTTTSIRSISVNKDEKMTKNLFQCFGKLNSPAFLIVEWQPFLRDWLEGEENNLIAFDQHLGGKVNK